MMEPNGADGRSPGHRRAHSIICARCCCLAFLFVTCARRPPQSSPVPNTTARSSASRSACIMESRAKRHVSVFCYLFTIPLPRNTLLPEYSVEFGSGIFFVWHVKRSCFLWALHHAPPQRFSRRWYSGFTAHLKSLRFVFPFAQTFHHTPTNLVLLGGRRSHSCKSAERRYYPAPT